MRLFDEVARALVAGRLPSREAALLIGGGMLAWIDGGGDLVRDYFQLTKPKSHRTPSAIWRELQSEPHPDEGEELESAGLSEASEPEPDQE